MRIVSLLPSATEILCELGLEHQIVGITHECDSPPAIVGRPQVTATSLPPAASSREIDDQVRQQLSEERSLYRLDHDALAALAPDLLITQTLCAVCAVAESDVQRALCRLPPAARVINLEPQSLADVLQTLETVAAAVGIPDQGQAVRSRLERRIQAVQTALLGVVRPRVVVLEWIDPPFSAGHWVPEIVELAGGLEVIGQPGARSNTLTWQDVIAARPEILIISCCGFTQERTRQDLPLLFEPLRGHDLPCLRSGQVYMMDGNAYLSRPGPRLVTAVEILASVFHPDRVPPTTIAGAIEQVPVPE